MATDLMSVVPMVEEARMLNVGRDILAELIAEKDCLDANFVHSKRLICEAIEKCKKEQAESQMDEQGNVHLTEKLYVNLEDHKQHNLIGRLLGPKGLTLKRMQVEANAKMSILGRGSTRDKKKEDENRESDNPNHAHLKEELHVLVEVVAPPDQARARLAAGVAEVKKMLVPPVPGGPDPIGDRYRDQDPVLYDQFIGGGRGYGPPIPPPGMRGGMRSPGPPQRGGRGGGGGRGGPPRRGGGGFGNRGGKGPGGRGGRGGGRGGGQQGGGAPTGYGDNFANDSNFSSFSDNQNVGGYSNAGSGGAGGYAVANPNLSYGGTAGGAPAGGGNWKAPRPRGGGDSGGYRHHPYQY